MQLLMGICSSEVTEPRPGCGQNCEQTSGLDKKSVPALLCFCTKLVAWLLTLCLAKETPQALHVRQMGNGI